MKNLKTYLEDLFTTPATTLGMGSVNFSTETQPGSGDIPNAGFVKSKRKKRFKRYKI